MGASPTDSVVGDFSCPHCGDPRIEKRRRRTTFSAAELADVERILAGRCFPCWCYENVVTVEELEQSAVIRRANSDSRQQLRQRADEIAGKRQGMWLEEVACHHCQNDAMMVVASSGDRPAQVKVLCTECKTCWL